MNRCAIPYKGTSKGWCIKESLDGNFYETREAKEIRNTKAEIEKKELQVGEMAKAA